MTYKIQYINPILHSEREYRDEQILTGGFKWETREQAEEVKLAMQEQFSVFRYRVVPHIEEKPVVHTVKPKFATVRIGQLMVGHIRRART